MGGLFANLDSATNYVGFSANATGHMAVVTATGSLWAASTLVVGQAGSGNALVITNGGTVSSWSASIGVPSASSSNSVLVSGPGSRWNMTNSLNLSGSRNLLTIEDGGTVYAGSAAVGTSSTPGSGNLVVLQGPNSKWVVTNDLSILGTRNSLNVNTGAMVTASGVLAQAFNSEAVRVDGPGALLTTAAYLSFWGAASSVQVRNGGFLSTPYLEMVNASDCAIELAGEGSRITVSDTFSVGASIVKLGTNRVTIGHGTELEASKVQMSPFQGLLRLTNLGSFVVTNRTTNASFVNEGGEVEQLAGVLRADRLVATNGGSIRFRGGALETSGMDPGTSGIFSVGEGSAHAVLRLLGGLHIFRNGLVVQSLGELRGTGTLRGNVTNYGLVEIPTFGSALLLSSNLTLASPGGLVFSVSPDRIGDTSGSLTVSGAVNLGGDLIVKLTDGYSPAAGDSFRVLRYGSLTGDFSNVSGGRVVTADRRGSFRLDRTGGSLLLADFQSEDLDGDGIQDSWARQYFGMSPLPPGAGPNGRDGDADGDGLTNSEEFRLNSDPLDRNSGLTVRVGLHPSGHPVLHFPYLPGRNFHIHSSSDLGIWTTVTTNNLDVDSVGNAEWIDFETSSGAQHFYYISAE